MKRKPPQSGKRKTQSGRRSRSGNNRSQSGNKRYRIPRHLLIVEQAAALVELAKQSGARYVRAGEIVVSFDAAKKPDAEAIGFEVPNQGEPEYEPEETKRRTKGRRGR